MDVTNKQCPVCEGILIDDPDRGKYCPVCGWGLKSEPHKIVCPKCGQLLNVKIEDNGAIVCPLNGDRDTGN